VPLLVSHPEGPDGVVCEGLAQSLDLAPTLAAIGDAEPMDTYGQSLAPTVTGERHGTERGVAVAEYFGQRYYWTHRVCWHEDTKYVFNPSGVDELYDLAADPNEMDNLAANPDPEAEATLKAMSRQLFETVRKTGDDTLARTDYPTLRYAPVGPHPNDSP
jgi:arylsulfatase A-like enzyme